MMWDYVCVSNPWSVLNLWIGKWRINLYKLLPKLASIIFKIGALINDFLPSDFLMQKIKKDYQSNLQRQHLLWLRFFWPYYFNHLWINPPNTISPLPLQKAIKKTLFQSIFYAWEKKHKQDGLIHIRDLFSFMYFQTTRLGTFDPWIFCKYKVF